MPDVSVRPARTADVEAISRIQLETWRTAWGHILPAGVLERATPDIVAEQWSAAVTAPPTLNHRVLVATDAETIVGFVAFGPAEPDVEPESAGASASASSTDAGTPPLTPGAAQIATMLVEPRWGRRGHGSRLLAATVEAMRADGFDTGLVWLYNSDRASEAFYTSAGWERDGFARALDTGAGELLEVRLHVALWPAS